MTVAHEMPPKERTIKPPEGGWKQKTLYLVWVAFRADNPIHQALFWSGFLTNGQPTEYNDLWNPAYERTYEIHELHYLEVIRKIEDIEL